MELFVGIDVSKAFLDGHVLPSAEAFAATRPAVRPLPSEHTQLLADLVTRRRQIAALCGLAP